MTKDEVIGHMKNAIAKAEAELPEQGTYPGLLMIIPMRPGCTFHVEAWKEPFDGWILLGAVQATVVMMSEEQSPGVPPEPSDDLPEPQ